MSVDLSVEYRQLSITIVVATYQFTCQPTCGDLCVGVLPNIAQSGGLKIVSVVVSTQVNLAASTCWISAVVLCVLYLYIVLENLITR